MKYKIKSREQLLTTGHSCQWLFFTYNYQKYLKKVKKIHGIEQYKRELET